MLDRKLISDNGARDFFLQTWSLGSFMLHQNHVEISFRESGFAGLETPLKQKPR
jgi:hypothetical protein